MRPFALINGKIIFSQEIMHLITSIHDLAEQGKKDPEIVINQFTDDLIQKGEVKAAAVINAAWDQKYAKVNP